MTTSVAPPQGQAVAARLSAMMFLEFLIWGGWYVTLSAYMTAHGMGSQIGTAYSLCPIAAIISPFFLGMIADRFFATEKILGILSLIGGSLLILVAVLSKSLSPNMFLGLIFLHTLCFMPTLGLTSSLTFHNVTDQEKQFPVIRVCGTIGWIAANWIVSKMLHGDELPIQFWVAGSASVLLGFYSFSLPHTPPPMAGKKVTAHDILGLDALALLKRPSFAIFIIGSLLICIPLAFYYAFAEVYTKASGFTDAAYTMSFGQIGEIFFMLMMPFLFKKFGVKYMLLAGMVAWVARYGLFAAGANSHWQMNAAALRHSVDRDGLFAAIIHSHLAWLVVGGIILHGICYDFFFVTGQIYVDKRASPKIRGQAQGFIILITQGVGMLIGAQAAGFIHNAHTVGTVVDWHTVWIIPSIAAAVIAGVFLVLFRDDSNEAPIEIEELPILAPA